MLDIKTQHDVTRTYSHAGHTPADMETKLARWRAQAEQLRLQVCLYISFFCVPYISAKEPHVSAQKPCVCSMYICPTTLV